MRSYMVCVCPRVWRCVCSGRGVAGCANRTSGEARRDERRRPSANTSEPSRTAVGRENACKPAVWSSAPVLVRRRCIAPPTALGNGRAAREVLLTLHLATMHASKRARLDDSHSTSSARVRAKGAASFASCSHLRSVFLPQSAFAFTFPDRLRPLEVFISKPTRTTLSLPAPPPGCLRQMSASARPITCTRRWPRVIGATGPPRR